MHRKLAIRLLGLYRNRDNMVSRAIFKEVCDAIAEAYGMSSNTLVAHVASCSARTGGIDWLAGYLAGWDSNSFQTRQSETDAYTAGISEALREG